MTFPIPKKPTRLHHQDCQEYQRTVSGTDAGTAGDGGLSTGYNSIPMALSAESELACTMLPRFHNHTVKIVSMHDEIDPRLAINGLVINI